MYIICCIILCFYINFISSLRKLRKNIFSFLLVFFRFFTFTIVMFCKSKKQLFVAFQPFKFSQKFLFEFIRNKFTMKTAQCAFTKKIKWAFKRLHQHSNKALERKSYYSDIIRLMFWGYVLYELIQRFKMLKMNLLLCNNNNTFPKIIHLKYSFFMQYSGSNISRPFCYRLLF